MVVELENQWRPPRYLVDLGGKVCVNEVRLARVAPESLRPIGPESNLVFFGLV